MIGNILWYDKLTGTGVIIDNESKQYNFNKSGLVDLFYVDDKDEVLFEVEENSTEGWVAVKIELVEQEECSHEWDMDEGGMCLNCGAEDWYNHFDEDYGSDR